MTHMILNQIYEQDQRFTTLGKNELGQANKSAGWMPWH